MGSCPLWSSNFTVFHSNYPNIEAGVKASRPFFIVTFCFEGVTSRYERFYWSRNDAP